MRGKRAEISELKTRLVLAAIVIVAMIVVAGSKDSMVRGASTGSAQHERELITRVDPKYPANFDKPGAREAVSVQIMVAPDGTVRTVKLLDGDPVLAQASINAVRKWKYAPAATDETLTVKIEFDGTGE